MNPYFSSAEKEKFVRMTALEILLKQAIEEYDSTKNKDKDFMKSLRLSHTYLLKAIKHRKSFLTEESWNDLLRQFSRLELIFVPSDKAWKEHQKVKELKTHLHIPINDFNDWYCDVIEHTCKTCTRNDFKQCNMRSIMQKYSITPYNPGAVDKCQYRYVESEVK